MCGTAVPTNQTQMTAVNSFIVIREGAIVGMNVRLVKQPNFWKVHYIQRVGICAKVVEIFVENIRVRAQEFFSGSGEPRRMQILAGITSEENRWKKMWKLRPSRLVDQQIF